MQPKNLIVFLFHAKKNTIQEHIRRRFIMTEAGAGSAILPQCQIFFQELLESFEDLGAIFEILNIPNDSKTATSLNLPREVKVTCHCGQGSLSIALPALCAGQYQGELARDIKRELGLQGLEYFDSSSHFLNINPTDVAVAYVRAAKILGVAMLEIRLVESKLRILEKDATKKVAAILKAHRP